MGKIRSFLGIFAFLMTVLISGVSHAATGYVCESYRKYTSCTEGYYMADTSGNYNGTADVGNQCATCPDDATFCPGETAAPLYPVTLKTNRANATNGITTIYRSASDGWYKGTTTTSVGEPITALSTSELPSLGGYVFDGYYTSTTGGAQVITADGTINSDYNTTAAATILYAHWKGVAYDCEAGTYWNPSTLNCDECPAGVYCPGVQGENDGAIEGQEDCYITSGTRVGDTNAEEIYADLPTWFTSEAGAKKASDCYLNIQPGTYFAQGGDDLRTCEAGFYCPGGKYYYGTTFDDDFSGNDNPVFDYTYGIKACPVGTSVAGSDAAADCTFDITLNVNGGNGTCGNTSNTVTCGYDAQCQLPTWNESNCKLTNGAKIFQGWGTTATATSGVGTSRTFTEPVTLYAVWKNPTCLITNGTATPVDTTTNTPTCAVTCNDGYSTSGTYSGTQHATSHAYTCSGNSITIDYNENSGSSVTNGSCTYGGSLTLPAAPTRTGYTFTGWKLSDGTVESASASVTCNSANLGVTSGTSTAVVAQWTNNVRTVTLDDSTNGGTGGSSKVYQKYATGWSLTNFGTTITKVTVPTKSNAVFLGYYTAATGGTRVISADGTLPANTYYTTTGSTTLYAQFSACSCTNGTGATGCSATVSNNVCNITWSCQSGYYKATKSTTASGGYTVTCDSCVTNAGSSYTASDDNRDTVNTCYYTCTKACTQQACPENAMCTHGTSTTSGKTYYGSSCNASASTCSLEFTCNTGYSENSDGTACVPNEYTITLDKNNTGANDASTGTPTLYTTYNTNVYLDSTRTKAMTTSTNGITKPTKVFTVTYNANNGSVSPASANATSTFAGYYSTESSNNGSGTQYVGTSYITSDGLATGKSITANATWYAKWTAGSVTLPTPTRTGYTFNGWYTAASGGTKIGDAGATYTPTASITLYAQWTGCPAGSYCQGDNVVRKCPTDSLGRTVNSSDKSDDVTDCFVTCGTKTIDNGATTVVKSQINYDGSAYPACTYTVNCDGGYGADGNNTSNPTCTQCTSGQYSTGGTSACLACSALDTDNTIINTYDLEGYTSKDGAASATECIATINNVKVDNNTLATVILTYNGSSYVQNTVTVTYCNAGYYRAAEDSAACTQCSGAYYCPDGDLQRSNCPIAESNWIQGTGDGWSTVTQCYETQQANVASDYCDGGILKRYATVNKTWSSETSVSTTLTAKAGAYVAETTCKQCEPGTYQSSDNYTGDTCRTADKGYYVDKDGATTQTQCPAGTYGNTTGLTTAACSGDCESGYYCPKGSDSAQAEKCPTADAGWTATSPSGSGDVTQCYEYQIGEDISQFCASGEIRRSAISTIKYSDTIAIHTTLSAVPGARINGNTCAQCDGAEWSSGGAVSSCTACPSVTDGWTLGTGTGWDDYSDCYQIKAATSVSNYCYGGQLKQNAADATTWGAAKVSTEFTADAGAYVSGSGADTTCELCAAGTYQGTDGSTATTCSACTGTYEYSSDGATQCATCDTGYQANSSHTGCEPRTFTLTYSCGDGSGNVTGGTYEFGSTVTLASGTGCTAPNNQKFAGWEYGGNVYSSFVWNVANNVTMTANYIDNTMFSLTYETYGGNIVDTGYTQQCSTSTSSFTLPQTVTRVGYDFGGWSASPCTTNCTPVDTLTLTCAADTTLYAIWTAREITCAAGQYLNGTTCTTCDQGYKCPSESQTYTYNASIQGRTVCVAGTYQDATGQTTCKEADAGYFVGTDGATSQTKCSNWTYQPDTGGTSCISCPTVESGYTKLDSADTGWTSYTQCIEIATASPANCASGKLQKIPTASGATTWGAATVNANNPLSANPNKYVDDTTCMECPDAYPYSSGGAIDDNKCYAKITKTGSQVNGDTPNGCLSVLEWNSCEPGTCDYFDYKGQSGETCTPASCSKTPKTVTARAGYYVNGATCQACSTLGGGMYTTSVDGNTGGASVCVATIAPEYYLENRDDSSATKCTAGYYCPGTELNYDKTGTRILCGMGYYCPAGSSARQVCPATTESDATPSTDVENAASATACSVGGIWRDDTDVENESDKIHGGQRCRCFFNESTEKYDTNCDTCTIVTCDAGYYLNSGACVPVVDGYYSPAITDGTKPTEVDSITTQQWQCTTGQRVNSTKDGCEPIEFTIEYVGNGNTGGSVESHTCKYGSDDCTASQNGFVRDGYDFVNWWCDGGTCDGNTINPGASLKYATTVDGTTITLTAQWSQSTTECQAGKYYNGTTHIECPAGWYCPGTGNATLGEIGCRLSCSDLGSEYTSDAGATASGECYTTCETECIQPSSCPENFARCKYITDTIVEGKIYSGSSECIADDVSSSYCKIDYTGQSGTYCDPRYYLNRDTLECIKCETLSASNGVTYNNSYRPTYAKGATACYTTSTPSGEICDYTRGFELDSATNILTTRNFCPEYATCTEGTQPTTCYAWYPNTDCIPVSFCSFTFTCQDGYTPSTTSAVEYGLMHERTGTDFEFASGEASCNPNLYYVVFDDNYFGGTSGTHTQVFTYAMPQKLDANTFTRTGYAFVEWNTREDGNGTAYQNEQEVNNLTTVAGGAYDLFAQWTPIDYTITYNPNGGENNAQNPDTYTIEDSIEFQAPSKTGYDFVGWFSDSALTTQVTGITAGTIGNQEFWAKWTPIVYDITYNMNNGENNAQNPATYTIESATITLQNPTRRGYTFVNWTNADGDVVTQIANGSIGNVVLNANWDVNTYDITYNPNGGENNALNPGTYTIEETPVTLNAPTKLGYTFVKWTGDNVSDDKIIENTIGAVTVTANWTPNTYTIKFDANDGTTSATTLTCEYDDETCVLEYDAEWTNHDFTGWKSEYNKTYYAGDVLTGLMTDMASAGDTETTLTATWNQRKLNCMTDVGAGKYYNGTDILSCPAGSYCPGNDETVNEGSQGCIYDCPAGSYCAASASTSTPCVAGTYCPAKATAPTDCPVGQYCPAQSEKPQTCPAGGATVVAKADSIATCRKVVSGANADQEFGYGTATWDCGYTSGTGDSAKYQTECVVKEVLTCQAGYYYQSELANNACSVVPDGYYSPAPTATDGVADANSLVAVACPSESGDNDGIGSVAPRATKTNCYTTCALTTDDISNSDTVTPDSERSFYVSGNDYPACSYTVKCATGYEENEDRTAPECNAKEYQIELNKNGGDGNLDAYAECTFDSGACSLPATNALTRPGYMSANKWCTNADGTGDCYVAGQTTTANVSPDGTNTKLFAIWEPAVFKIDFNTTGATSDTTIAPVYLKYTVGWFGDANATQAIAKLPTLPEKTNWVFLGFKLNDVMITDADGYLATTQNALSVTTMNDTASVVWTEGATECDAGYYYYYDAASGQDGECRPCEKGYWCDKGTYITNQETGGLETCPTYQSANGATVVGTTDGGVSATTAEACYSVALDTYVSDTGNATGTQTCYYDADTKAYDALCDDFVVTSCAAGYWYESGTDCAPVGKNYYSGATDMKRYQCPDSGITDTTTAGEIYSCFKTVDYQASYGSGTKVCNYTAKNDDGTANYGTGCRELNINACQSGYYLENANAIDCTEVGKNYYSGENDTMRHGCPTDTETGLTGVTNTEKAGTAGECYIENNPFQTEHGAGRQRCDCNSATLKYDMCSGRVFETCDAGYYWNKSDNTDCVPVGYGFFGPVKDDATGYITANKTCPLFDGRQGLTKTETSADASACYMTEIPCNVTNGAGIKTCGYDINAGDYSANCTACMLDTCDEGYYINNNQCDLCPAGSVCSDATRTGYNGVANAEPELCANLFNGRYPESDVGSVNVNQCFGECDKLANVSTMIGRDYYGMADTCEIKQCNVAYYLNNDKSACTLCPADSVCNVASGSDMDEDGTPDDVPRTCASLTGGTHPLASVGSVTVADCYTTCTDYEILGGMAIRDMDSVQYDDVCTYHGVSETGNPCEIQTIKGYETCVEKSCNADYELIDGRCQKCNRYGATSYKPNGNCLVATCESGLHPDGDECAENIVSCTLPNAYSATQEWDDKRGAFGPCVITACNGDYHIEANTCVPNTQICDIEHGIGTRDWDETRGQWGECIATSCDAGYTNDLYDSAEPNKQCGRCRNATSELNQPAVSTYISGCTIGACMYQGELYNLENNECVPICPTDKPHKDETGTIFWNNVTKKCERQCFDGYMPW